MASTETRTSPLLLTSMQIYHFKEFAIHLSTKLDAKRAGESVSGASQSLLFSQTGGPSQALATTQNTTPWAGRHALILGTPSILLALLFLRCSNLGAQRPFDSCCFASNYIHSSILSGAAAATLPPFFLCSLLAYLQLARICW